MAVYAPFAAGAPLTADDLNKLIVRELMEWTPLTSLGTFTAPFSASTYVPRMRKIMKAGTEYWEFEGAIACASWTANTTQNAFTFTDNANKPSHELGAEIYAAGTQFYPVRLGYSTGGVINLGAPTAALTGATSVTLTGMTFSNPQI